MKKLLYCAAALATMFFSACQQENLEPAGKGSTVSFSVEVPGLAVTKADVVDNGSNINDLVYAVYKVSDDATTLDEAVAAWDNAMLVYQVNQTTTAFAGGKTTVDLELLNDQNYVVLFWAQVNDAWVAGNDFDLTEITYPANMTSSNSDLAAFSGRAFIAADDVEKSVSREVTLTRPFAQINVGTTLPQAFTVQFVDSKVTVCDAGESFSVASQSATGTTDVVFGEAALPTNYLKVEGDATDYTYVAMNYVFANGVVEVEYDIETLAHGTVNKTIPSVPVEKNFRTNIIGNLLTSNAHYEIKLDAEWGAPEYILGDAWSQTGNFEYTVNEGAPAGTLKAILEHAEAQAAMVKSSTEGPAITINLSADVEWETGAASGSTPLITANSTISAVTINGNGKTFTATGAGVGSVRMANGGLLTFNNVKVVDKSVSYAENNWEYGYLEFGGNLKFENCEVVNAIMPTCDNAQFINCYFNSNKDNEYAVWVNGGSASFTECTFAGARGLKVHEAYGSEVAAVVVDDCLFDHLTKKPGIALGDLNADTAVTIQNSVFDSCQAGDQNNYMYETDTDVTTFEFTCTGNLVIPSGDGFLKQEDGSYIVASAAGLKAAINASVDGDVIRLNAGTYDDLFHVGSKCITLTSLKSEKAVVAGRVSVAGNPNTTATFENLNFAVSENVNGLFNNQYYDKGKGYIIGIYCGNVVVKDCEFTGMTDDAGAITYHNYDSGASTANLEKLVVENCKFVGGRAIRARSNVSVTGCQFEGLINPCLQILGLGADHLAGTVEFTNNSSDVLVSGVCIKTSNYPTKNITFNVGGNTNCNLIAFDGKNVNNLYPETYTYTGAVTELVPEDAKGLQWLIEKKVPVISLLPVTYEGTFEPKVTTSFKSVSATEKATLKGRVNIRSITASFDDLKFEINDASKVKWTGNVGADLTSKPAIVMAYTNEGTIAFNNCDFELNTAAGALTTTTSAKPVFNNCTFNGKFRYPIYSRANIEVTNCTYATTITDVFIGACLNCITNGKVVFENNTLVNSSNVGMSAAIVFCSTNNVGGKWVGPVEFTVKNNTGFGYTFERMNNFTVDPNDHSFTEGSETFSF